MSLSGTSSKGLFRERDYWPCHWNWCRQSFLTESQLLHHVDGHIDGMLSIKRSQIGSRVLSGSPKAGLKRPIVENIANDEPLTQSSQASLEERGHGPLNINDSVGTFRSPPKRTLFRNILGTDANKEVTPSPSPLPPSPPIKELLALRGTWSQVPIVNPPSSPSPNPAVQMARSRLDIRSNRSQSPSPKRARLEHHRASSSLPPSSPPTGYNTTQTTNLTPETRRLAVTRAIATPSTPERIRRNPPTDRVTLPAEEEEGSDPVSDYLNLASCEPQTPGRPSVAVREPSVVSPAISDVGDLRPSSAVGSRIGDRIEGSESEWLGFDDPHYDNHGGDETDGIDGHGASTQLGLPGGQSLKSNAESEEVEQNHPAADASTFIRGEAGVEVDFKDDGVDESEYILAGFQTQAPADWMSSIGDTQ